MTDTEVISELQAGIVLLKKQRYTLLVKNEAIEAENKRLRELAIDGLGMCFDPLCPSCVANKKENESRAEIIEQALKNENTNDPTTDG